MRIVNIFLAALVIVSLFTGATAADESTADLFGAVMDEVETEGYRLNVYENDTVLLSLGYGNSVQDLALPEEVEGHRITGVETQAFFESDVRSVTFPDSMTYIGDFAFLYCYGLEEVKLPNDIARIMPGTFSYCGSLSGIDIPASVTDIGERAFMECAALEDIQLPERLASIGDSAFSGCASLTDIAIPEGVAAIGSGAFQYTALKGIVIPASVKAIGSNPFCGCAEFESIEVSADSDVFAVIDGALVDRNAHRLICCPGARTAEGYAVSEEVTVIGKSAFSQCNHLVEVTIPEGVTAIEDEAFFMCDRLASVRIPQSVTSIGKDAFSLCPNLTVIAAGNSYTAQYCEEHGIPCRAA